LEKECVRWPIRVSPALDKLVDEAVRKGVFSSRSDLVREAVRLRLEQVGFRLDLEREIDNESN
jgi:Arc/MetJ-type ribon-helix-helix transcriptional regulator